MTLILVLLLMLIAYIKTFKEDFNKQEILGSSIFLIVVILIAGFISG